MAEDANAAIRGAFEGGATDVLVNDSHGGQRNLLPEDLDPRARLISHSFKRYGMMEGLDETFDAVDLRRLSRQGGFAARPVRAHRLRRRPRPAGQRPSVGEGGMNAAAGRVVRRARRRGHRRRRRGRGGEGRGARHSRRGGEARHQHARGRTAAAGRGPARHPGRRGRASQAAKKPAPRATGASYQVRMQFRNFTIPEVASAFSEMTAGGARHGGVHARDDARSLPADPRALPLHQPGLTSLAVNRGVCASRSIRATAVVRRSRSRRRVPRRPQHRPRRGPTTSTRLSGPSHCPDSHSGTTQNASAWPGLLFDVARLDAGVRHRVLQRLDRETVTCRAPRNHQDQRIATGPPQHRFERRAVQQELRAAIEQPVRQVEALAIEQRDQLGRRARIRSRIGSHPRPSSSRKRVSSGTSQPWIVGNVGIAGQGEHATSLRS